MADVRPEPIDIDPSAQPDHSPRYRRVGVSSVVYLAGALFSKLAKFLLIPIYVRVLTKSEVGMIVFLDALTFALVRFFPLGLYEAVKRFNSDFDSDLESDRYTAGIWWISVAACLLFAGLAWATGPVWFDWVDPAIPNAYLVLAVAIAALMGNAWVPASRYIARQQAVAHTLYTSGQLGLMSVAVILMVLGFDQGVAGVLWGQLGAAFLWTVYTGVLTSRWAGWRPRFTRIKESFAFSLPFVPNLVFVWGITFADRLLLLRHVDLDQMAIYGLGYQIGTLITIFSLSVTNAWIARFFHSADEPTGPEEFSTTFTRLTLPLLALSMATFVLAPELVLVAGTAEYLAAVPILQVIAGAHVFHGLNRAFFLPLLHAKRTGLVSLSSGLGFGANIALNLLLIPRYGIHGAAIATILSYLVLAVSSFLFARMVYPVRLDSTRLGLAGFLACGLCAASLLVPSISVVGTGARGLLVASFPLLLLWPRLRLTTPADRAAVFNSLRKLTRRRP